VSLAYHICSMHVKRILCQPVRVEVAAVLEVAVALLQVELDPRVQALQTPRQFLFCSSSSIRQRQCETGQRRKGCVKDQRTLTWPPSLSPRNTCSKPLESFCTSRRYRLNHICAIEN